MLLFFLLVQYSVGVMYLVILNLPHWPCFKRENVIVIGVIIPGAMWAITFSKEISISSCVRPSWLMEGSPTKASRNRFHSYFLDAHCLGLLAISVLHEKPRDSWVVLQTWGGRDAFKTFHVDLLRGIFMTILTVTSGKCIPIAVTVLTLINSETPCKDSER